MSSNDNKNGVWKMLLGAAITLVATLAAQWFQLAKQQSFESEQTKRQEQFQERSLQAQQKFQHDEGQRAVQRAKLDRTMAALENHSSAYTKGSTKLIIHTAQLAPDVARVVEQPTPSYEAALEVASKYEQIVKEMTDWLGETGPHQSMLEILTGRKGPTEGFTFLSGLSGAVDRNDVKKRRDLLIMVQRQVAQLQTALLRNARASTAFMGAVQRSLTE